MFAASKTAGVSGVANYIEDVFSTWLYTGNGSTQTITNGIDLSTKGGLVWSKSRSNVENNVLLDTIRGPNNILVSNSTAAGSTSGTPYVTATTTGYSIGTSNNQINGSGLTYASWTFREQPKFFDVVTYTGTGANTTIAHALGSVPGSIFVKRTDTTGAWQVYHRSLANTEYMVLNTTAAKATGATRWNSTTPTSTVFSLGTDATVNASGGTYVAYIFAHDAGGFGLTGTDNVISCGSFENNATVNLGWEPQLVLFKRTDSAEDWIIQDSMRGFFGTFDARVLYPNLSNAEGEFGGGIKIPNATGFTTYNFSGTHIYIAIRRGPMKVPTSGTSVFEPITRAGTSADATVSLSSVRPDVVISKYRSGSLGSGEPAWFDRLRGPNKFLASSSSAVENSANTDTLLAFLNQSYTLGADAGAGVINFGSQNYVNYALTRAPSFMDEVCYTGTGSARTVTHNLGAVPDLLIFKNRIVAGRYWAVYSANRGVANALALNQTNAEFSGTSSWNGTAPTSSVFTVNTHTSVNESGATYVAYLFATCAGVSKVGSYTGTATTLQVDCGFTAGARFVLIKRTDSTGDWYVWDSARGIIAGNDPYLLLNSTAAEVTSTDYVDTYSAGFEISSTAPAAINANGGTFIFLAIA